MKPCADDTIAAAATPPGRGALAVIRVSGAEALQILSRVFFPASGADILKERPRTTHYGDILDETGVVDEVVVSIMRAPASYTGEDMAEISCHGGNCAAASVLDVLLRNGARPAGPGEFTMRAFLNGKMDLTQAEAVNHVISARSEKALRKALILLKGGLRKRLEPIEKELTRVRAGIDAGIEWGETEDIQPVTGSEAAAMLNKLTEVISDIIGDSCDAARLSSGFRVVIGGKTNAGKSTLFNTLLKRPRSIVSAEPGTTRDAVDGEMILDGFLIRITDTAGIGLSNPSGIDRAASERAAIEMENADLILYVIDGFAGAGDTDRAAFASMGSDKSICVISKSDLDIDRARLKDIFPGKPCVMVSCADGRGIEGLKKMISEALRNENGGELMITARQRGLLRFSRESILAASQRIGENMWELAAADLAQAAGALGEIDGSLLKEDLLDRIFSDFCIGK